MGIGVDVPEEHRLLPGVVIDGICFPRPIHFHQRLRGRLKATFDHFSSPLCTFRIPDLRSGDRDTR